MADVPPSTPTPPPEDMHWGISYLREDIQDLRQDVRAIHSRIDSKFAVLLTVMIALAGVVIGANFAFLRLLLPAN
ncbi:MAG: hypothetical protein VCF24_15605 [Candidatus Latescibacterota bacterium]